MAVGFADMVGFTMLSQHLRDEELAAVVARFEALAHDTVVALGGRVVKMIGDEVMFVVPTATGAASIGLSLAEAYAGGRSALRRPGGPGHRPGAGPGRRLLRPGGQPGQPAGGRGQSRHRAGLGRVPGRPAGRGGGRAGPEGGRDGGAGRFELRALRTRNLKDIGRIQAWKLSRAGAEPGADRRRNMRWERLEGVLRELDELRDRGEQVGRIGDRTGRPTVGP